jgi:hypothetical protein
MAVMVMSDRQALSYFFALTAGSMGMVDCAAWIHIQWANLKVCILIHTCYTPAAYLLSIYYDQHAIECLI